MGIDVVRTNDAVVYAHTWGGRRQVPVCLLTTSGRFADETENELR